MFPILRAIVGLEWRLTVNRLIRSTRRDALEQASRWSEVAVTTILIALGVPLALALLAAGAVAGWALAQGGAAANTVALVIGIVVAIPTVWAALQPFRALLGTTVERGVMLRLLPIPASTLRFLDAVRALTDPLVLVFLPALLFVGVGALAAGRPILAFFSLLVGLTYTGCIALLSNLLSLCVRLVLRGRRRAELVTLVFFLLVSVAGVLPQLAFRGHEKGDSHTTAAPITRGPAAAAGGIPRSLRLLPPATYALALRDAAIKRWWDALASLAGLATMAALLYAAATPLYRRLLAAPAPAHAPAANRLSVRHPLHLPFVPGVAVAVAQTQLRILLRSVRGKATLLYPAVTTTLLALVFARPTGPVAALAVGPLVVGALALLICLTQVATLSANQFALHRQGLLLELLLPLEARQLLAGRALAFAVLAAGAMVVALLPLALLYPDQSAATWLSLLLGGIAAHVALAPLAAFLSAVFPKPTDLSRLGRAGQPHTAANLVTLLAGAVAIAPVAVWLAFAKNRSGPPWLAPLLPLVYLGVAVVASRFFLPVAARLFVARRDNLVMVAVGR